MKGPAMLHQIKLFLIMIPFMLLLDFIWIARLMQGFYIAELGSYARLRGAVIEPVYWAALLVYLALPLGILLFSLPRVNPDDMFRSALCWGALFGLVVYVVYDLTNMATLERWSLKMTIVDIGWGCFLCGVTTVFAAYADRWLK